MLITALLSALDLKVNFMNLFVGTTLIVLSQNLKSSEDLLKICLNSTQHFLINQTQKETPD